LVSIEIAKNSPAAHPQSQKAKNAAGKYRAAPCDFKRTSNPSETRSPIMVRPIGTSDRVA
jgi:hypothetical protein